METLVKQIPSFFEAHEKAQADETVARELEQKRKHEEALDQNVSLGKFGELKYKQYS